MAELTGDTSDAFHAVLRRCRQHRDESLAGARKPTAPGPLRVSAAGLRMVQDALLDGRPGHYRNFTIEEHEDVGGVGGDADKVGRILRRGRDLRPLGSGMTALQAVASSTP